MLFAAVFGIHILAPMETGQLQRKLKVDALKYFDKKHQFGKSVGSKYAIPTLPVQWKKFSSQKMIPRLKIFDKPKLNTPSSYNRYNSPYPIIE